MTFISDILDGLVADGKTGISQIGSGAQSFGNGFGDLSKGNISNAIDQFGQGAGQLGVGFGHLTGNGQNSAWLGNLIGASGVGDSYSAPPPVIAQQQPDGLAELMRMMQSTGFGQRR